MSILARTQHLRPSSEAFCISPHSRRFSATGCERYLFSCLAIRSFFCSSCGDGSTYAMPSSSMRVCSFRIAAKWSEVWLTELGVMLSRFRSSMIASSYSPFSLLGLVSSKRSSRRPSYCVAKCALSIAALTCPMCRWPLGSGGKRVTTLPISAPGSGISMLPASLCAPKNSCATFCIGSRPSTKRHQRVRCGRALACALSSFSCARSASQTAASARPTACPAITVRMRRWRSTRCRASVMAGPLAVAMTVCA
mmetsp:Transcript_13958/g.32943  ORF Transcript_13958/g.32943 Transcript_13958/m.32943 type:complete len:252 (+) Transcript_13958:790-1545(+)